jgi:hypothetical protein
MGGGEEVTELTIFWVRLTGAAREWFWRIWCFETPGMSNRAGFDRRDGAYRVV